MTKKDALSWEQAVRWYRSQPENESEIINNYFDLPVRQAAERYEASEEFAEVLNLLGKGDERRLLDLGAGNGIASFALARNGWSVTALEPDDSKEVGAGAIRRLASDTGLTINVVQEFGETLPFPNHAFDAVHARQVLHHASDLLKMVAELKRVLRPGGLLLCTREHVADDQHQLTTFLEQHPLQHLYGGENAYPLEEYLNAFSAADLKVISVWGPLQSILNYFPGTEQQRQIEVRQIAKHSYWRFGRLGAWSSSFRESQLERYTRQDSTPGRIYSFLVKNS